MRRRHFLGTLAAAPLLPAGRLFAAPLAAPRFLLVFLRGGYDCANTLVPYTSDFYYESRPNIAIARPYPTDIRSAMALDVDWGLAPVLRESIGQMYRSREVAFVPFAGTDDLSRSHFETQDSIERGLPTEQHDFRSGFMARLSATLKGRAKPIAFTDGLPIAFRGDSEIPNIALQVSVKPVFDQRQSSILADMYRDHHLHAAVTDGLELRQHVALEFLDEMRKASRGAINARGFADHGQLIARLMKEEYRLGFVDVGGWDTHVEQGGSAGQLANNLDNLGRGLVAFAEELGSEWKNTVVVVVSEFGRTLRENGNKGTDHGHGSVYWVLGGGISGGRIAGEQVRVQQATLLQDRDFPVLNDYRGLLGGLFARLWDLNAEQMQNVFPQARAVDLRLV